MKRELITISDSGKITVPSQVKMSISEIANLFDIYHQTAKRAIRSIEKSGVADGDYSMTCTAEGLKVYPEYYGLDMVVAVAFRVQSTNAKVFRRWVIRRATKREIPRTILLPRSKMELN